MRDDKYVINFYLLGLSALQPGCLEKAAPIDLSIHNVQTSIDLHPQSEAEIIRSAPTPSHKTFYHLPIRLMDLSAFVLEPVDYEGSKERYSPAMYTDDYLLIALKPFQEAIVGASARAMQSDDVVFVIEDMQPVSENTPWNHWGFVDLDGQVVIPPVYRDALAFSEGLAAVRLPGTGWGYIDKVGQLQIPFMYDTAGFFSEGVAPVELDGQVGYINTSGQWVIQPQFFWGGSFRQGRAVVVVDYEENLRSRGSVGPFDDPKFAVIDRKGRQSRHFRKSSYSVRKDWPQWFPPSPLLPFTKKGKMGYKNRQGKIVIQTAYEEAWPFSEGLGPVNRVQGDGISEYINMQGEIVFTVPYEPPRPFHNGRVFLFDDEQGRWGVYDRQGQLVFDSLPFCYHPETAPK